MIFKSRLCFESASSSGSSGRPKKTSSKKPRVAEEDVKQGPKRRSKSTPEGENFAVEVVKSDFVESPVMVSEELDDGYHGEELNDMSGVNEETQWQQEGNVPFAPGHDGPVSLDEMVDEDGYYFDDGSHTGEQNHISQNQILLTLSYSLMNQVRQTARMEGVLPEDILIELIAEGVTRRAFEDAQRPAPSHLMTRTGYVAPDANGNVHQPQLSHHGMQGNNRGHHNGHNGRRFNQNNNRGNNFQGRNRQNNHFKNKQRNGK